jgi:hypothetical protein
MVEACDLNLCQINVIAPTLKWDEKDLPATDILGARLRAKFYGAKVITYRNFLLSILQISPNEKLKPEVVQYAIKCIKALIKSTTAFYGLGDPGSKRLMVTNIWGTAHAYVLSIAFGHERTDGA